MKKIKSTYLDENGRLRLVGVDGKQYRIDSDDYENPRFVEIPEDVIGFDPDLKPSLKGKQQ